MIAVLGFAALVFWKVVLALVLVAVIGLSLRRLSTRRRLLFWPLPRISTAPVPRQLPPGSGIYLGDVGRGRLRRARDERAVLLLGPPRSGKTSAVIIPALLAHRGPVVSTSTKADVLAATGRARRGQGRVWEFSPTADAGCRLAEGVRELRWSPVTGSASWDGALAMARSMVLGAGVGHGVEHASHWTKRAQALLAAMLHAAALSGAGVDQVQTWVLAHELDAPGLILEQHGARRAAGLLLGLINTEARELSSILSAGADALDAYSSEAALLAASHPNFDADAFVRSRDSIFIHAPAEQQQLIAPLVCGLLAEIRAATYRACARGELRAPVLFALDEVANIAPLSELPAIASEGGGQGLLLLAVLQDLSQARARWGAAAEGFLTLFGSKLILAGIADRSTLETVSLALGEYDREVESVALGGGSDGVRRTRSLQRQRVLSPGEIANIPAGRALHLDGVKWELLALTPAFRCEPWRSLITGEQR